FADLNEDTSTAAFSTDFQEVDFSIVEPDDAPAAPVATGPEEEARQENQMRQELESVDFYIAQGYADIAVDTLEMLERQFGPHPDIQARREKLAARDQQQPVEQAAVFEFGNAEEVATPAAPAEPITFDADSAYATLVDGGNNAGTAKPAAGIDAGLAELFEEF